MRTRKIQAPSPCDEARTGPVLMLQYVQIAHHSCSLRPQCVLQATLAQGFIYNATDQPTLISITPAHVAMPSGGSITIAGSKMLPAAGDEIVTISLGGLPCVVSAVTDTSVTCSAAQTQARWLPNCLCLLQMRVQLYACHGHHGRTLHCADFTQLPCLRDHQLRDQKCFAPDYTTP